MNVNERINVFENILKEIDSKLKEGSTIPDVGCGNFNTVKELLSRGYSAYGCDLKFKEGDQVSALDADNCIRHTPYESRNILFPYATNYPNDCRHI